MGHAGILGLSGGMFGGDTQGATGNPSLELKREVDRVKMQELFNDMNERREFSFKVCD